MTRKSNKFGNFSVAKWIVRVSIGATLNTNLLVMRNGGRLCGVCQRSVANANVQNATNSLFAIGDCFFVFGVCTVAATLLHFVVKC